VFHYTNQAGFLGILREKAIWATDPRYLNDAREYSMGFDRIVAELEKRTAGQTQLQQILADALGPHTAERALGMSVTSFSLAEDDLSQWRAYGGGSGGICIGFEPDALATRIHITGSCFGAVRYTETEQSDIVDKLCTDIIDDGNQVLSKVTSASVFEIRCALSVQLACVLIKHPKFADEREWRMLVWSSLVPWVNPGVRAGRSTIVPYHSVRLDTVIGKRKEFGAKLPLGTIWIGPTPHPTLALRGALVALSTFGESASLQLSEVPFRNW